MEKMSEERWNELTAELEERWNKLHEELKKVNISFPSLESLGGWRPRNVSEKRGGVVLAAKKEDGVIKFKVFKPVGVWKEVYDLLVLRNKIEHEMGKIARKLDGPAVFTSKEFADESDKL